MSHERSERIKELFDRALARSPDERQAFLTEACQGDEALLQETQGLIIEHHKAGEFLHDALRTERSTEFASVTQGPVHPNKVTNA